MTTLPAGGDADEGLRCKIGVHSGVRGERDIYQTVSFPKRAIWGEIQMRGSFIGSHISNHIFSKKDHMGCFTEERRCR